MKQSKWSSIRHAKWFIPVSVVLAVLLIGGAVFAYANWQSANLKGQGVITVTSPPPDYSYTVNGVTAVTGGAPITEIFGTAYPPQLSVTTGGAIYVLGAVQIENTGDVPIAGFTLSNIVFPAGIVNPGLEIVSVSAGVGEGDSMDIFLTGTAPATPGTIDLSGLTCTITPTGP